MSRWGKPIKNNKRFDARYFMNERTEQLDEVWPESGEPGIGGTSEEEFTDTRDPDFSLPSFPDDEEDMEGKAIAKKLGMPWEKRVGWNKIEPGDFDWESITQEFPEEETADLSENDPFFFDPDGDPRRSSEQEEEPLEET